MDVLFISPELTINEYKSAKIFLSACRTELENNNVVTHVISRETQLVSNLTKLNENLLMIFFNNEEDKYSKDIEKFMEEAKSQQVIIWPVAMNEKSRPPICKIEQSFDVYEQLRCRNLNDDYLETIGLVFARKIISRVFPTLYRDNGLLFVSHRRVDGENIAAKLCDQLSIQARNNGNFRDVVNVNVGEEAQKVIDSALVESDVLIFLHTEKSSESVWIEKELIYAVLYNIPIIWVRINNADESRLRIKPGDKPNIECSSEDFNNQSRLVEIVDDILQKSFELIMLNSNNVYDRINSFNKFCEAEGLKLIEKDSRNLIYNLVSPRKGYRYPQRDIKQYIQYFGRRFRKEDYDEMDKFIKNEELNKHHSYDSVILLSDKVKLRKVNNQIVEDNYEDFLFNWKKYANQEEVLRSDEIIISGSFPECNEIYKQSLYEAVTIFAKEILKNNYILTFGSHPTFQNIFFEIGKKLRPNDYIRAINMFVSKKYKDYYDMGDLCNYATVTEVDEIEQDKLKSLTKMREKMINRSNVKALICLGGVIRDGDCTQGIDEEIKIARKNHIPVFLVGTVGGRSSQLASEYKKSGNWSELNKESKKLNEKLAFNLDYRNLINEIITTINKIEE